MSLTSIPRPAPDEHSPSYTGYISQVPDGDLIAFMERDARDTVALLAGLSEEQALSRYAPGKWSVKEVMGHVNDSERIFSYRALRFARGDASPLAGFDQDAYIPAGRFDARSLADLAAEFAAARAASVALARSFDAAALERRGVANGKAVSVRALLWVIAGHARHHVTIVKERYLAAVARGSRGA